MTTEALLRPQSAGRVILRSGSGIGTNDSNTIIFMKVASARFSLSVGVQDVTGDGDEYATMVHNNELRGQAQFNGFVLAEHDIGIEELIITIGGTEVNPMAVEFTSAEDRIYKFNMVVKDVTIDWNRQAPVIGMSVNGLMTGEVGSTSEHFQEASS